MQPLRNAIMTESPATLEHAFKLQQSGHLEEAEAIYQSLLDATPEHLDALHLLGLIKKYKGSYREAVELIQKAIQKNPQIAFLHNNLGNTFKDMGLWPAAEASYLEALRLEPKHTEAHNNLGNLLRDQGQYQKAMEHYQAALKINRKFADAWNNLGGVHQKLGDLNEAARHYREALRLQPTLAVAHYNLGNVLNDAGHIGPSIDHLREAVRLKPDYLEAATSLLRQLQTTCTWDDDYYRLMEQMRHWSAGEAKGKIFPFAFLALPTSLAEQQLCARNWAQNQYRAQIEHAKTRPFTYPPAHSGKLRIGYLSSDFHNHATAYLMAEIFELHDRERFEIIAFSRGRDDGKEMRQRLIRAFDRFIDLSEQSIMEAAQTIHAAGIDILIDLKGYTRDTGSAIMALRPAPIQVNYLGYPGTMGADFIDYLITDHFVTPLSAAPYFNEKFAYLPDCYQANDRKRAIASPPTREECGLPAQGMVFCCFNHTYKITPEVFEVWTSLLKNMPGSVLWLLKSNERAEENLRKVSEGYGIESKRLIFAPEMPLDRHLARMQLADLFLDTFPVNAHTTASDALWAGLPVLTYAGETFISRVAGSLLRTMGLEELITHTLPDYADLALKLAQTPRKLEEIRETLKANRDSSALFDSPKLTRALESLYQRMWQIRCSGEAPRHIDSEAITASEPSAAAAVPYLELLEWVPAHARNVLDVNCGNGALGQVLKKRLGCRVTGIEPDPAQAALAGLCLDAVSCGPLADALEKLPAASFDAILMADALSATTDVNVLLTAVREKLAADGRLILSAPNHRHWSMLRRLLEDDWEESAGLVLTQKGLVRLLNRHGFRVQQIYALTDSSSIPGALMQSLNASGLNVSTLAADARRRRYVMVCS